MLKNAVITAFEEVTADWLTNVLTTSGALSSGAVESFTADRKDRLLSTSIRLDLRYTPDSVGEKPRKLFLKLVNIDQEDEFFGASEVNYYVRDYAGAPDVPIPRCYDAAYSEALGRYHLLIDDFGSTHVPAYERAPTLEHGLALAEGFAALHAHWWGADRLAQGGEPIHDAAHIRSFIEIAQPGAGHIIAAYANQLKPHWPDAIYTLYEKHPPLMIERTRNGNGFTLIHGDAGAYNILVPREGVRPIYVIDRQPFNWSLTTWLGVYDLAFLMVLDWETEARRALEEPALRHYHAELVRRGVSGYEWDQLWEDYRLCAAMGVYISTEWCRGQFYPDTMPSWMPMLQRSMTAVDDLRISDLW